MCGIPEVRETYGVLAMGNMCRGVQGSAGGRLGTPEMASKKSMVNRNRSTV